MKAAVIGVGRMGRRHIQAAMDAGHEICGIVDVSEESLALAEKELGVTRERWFLDVSEMLAKAKPELVIVATTAPTHCEYTILSAESGAKFVLCEKPMAISLDQCDRMMEVCGRTGTGLAINHPARFLNVYQHCKSVVDSGEIGDIGSVTLVGGNVGLAMNGTHFFEVFRLLTGETAAEVTAWFSADKVPNPRGAQFDDVGGQVRATSASGKRLYFEIGTDQGHGLQMIVAGRYGTIAADCINPRISVSSREESIRHLPTHQYGGARRFEQIELPPLDIVAATRRMLEELVVGGDFTTAEQGRAVVRAVVAAETSARSGSIPVAVDEASLDRGHEFPWA